MYYGEKGYLQLLSDILKHGEVVEDRTGTGTISLFAPSEIKFDLREGFPLLTTKKMSFKTIAKELQWFLSGSTNVRDLILLNCNIWNADAYRWFKQEVSKRMYRDELREITIDEYVEKIKKDGVFAGFFGDLGPIYGYQWRNFNGSGVDQIENLIKEIKENPRSRRLIINGWNPAQQADMALPPCHVMYQFNVTNNGLLNLKMTQRSADMFLGSGFNIASSCLLLSLVAKECNLTPGVFTYSLGDAHIYLNHIEAVKEQLKRAPKELCKLVLVEDASVLDFKYEQANIENYEYHPKIKADISVGN